MNGLFTHLNLKPSNPLTLEALTNKLRERETHFLPDVTITLNEVRVDDNLNIVLPNSERTFALNGHSKSQLNTLLGFRFDKWFEQSPIDVKRDELNTRLKRASSTVKFRLIDKYVELTPEEARALMIEGKKTEWQQYLEMLQKKYVELSRVYEQVDG